MRLVFAGVVLIAWVGCSDAAPPPEPTPVWEPDGAVEQACASMCEETIANGCEMSSSLKRCAENCAESVELTGECQDVTRDYVDCLGAEGLDNCYDVPLGCDDAWLTWSMCSASGNGCGPVQCGAPEQGCECRAFCADALVQERCVPNGDVHDCTCSVDDVVVATCTAQILSCAFFVGCCGSVVDTL